MVAETAAEYATIPGTSLAAESAGALAVNVYRGHYGIMPLCYGHSILARLFVESA
jgi:hypothetical protein